MTTIVDVARAAGVSTATVSRVLNGHTQVDPALAANVMAVVKDLGYHPSRVARSLRTRRNRVWALIISDVRTGPFFADVVRGVEDVAYEAGYSLFLCNTDEDSAKEASYIDLAVAENVAGVILTPSGPRTELAPLLNFGVQVVLADRVLPTQAADSVIVDNVGGAYEAVRHLLDGGYTNIACITGPLRTTTGSQRYAGYARALQEANIKVDERLTPAADFREEGGRRSMQQLLSQPARPDAVFVTNHLMTIGALQAISEAGLEIPTDIAIVSFDDMSWSRLLKPPLTAIAQPAYDLGAESARLLLSRLDGYTGAPRNVILMPTLHIRGSSTPKPSSAKARRRQPREARHPS